MRYRIARKAKAGLTQRRNDNVKSKVQFFCEIWKLPGKVFGFSQSAVKMHILLHTPRRVMP